MKWTKLKERECLITLVFLKIEIFMENWDGFQILMLSVPKITMIDMSPTEKPLMAQWTITWHLTIQPWPIQSFSDKMPQVNQWQEKEFRQWVFRTNPSMGLPWDLLKVLFKLLFTLLLLSLIEIFQTNGKIIKKFTELNNLLILFHFCVHLILNGTNWQNLQEEEEMMVREVKEVSPNREITLLQLDSRVWINKTKRKELSKSEEKTDGTHTSSLFQNIMNKFTHQWKFHSKEFD